MSDVDGPVIAEAVYKDIFSHNVIDTDVIAYALDAAIERLRQRGVSPERWATFVHIGA
jgi:hypothetical protein